jgi:hypothetical protein
MTSSIWAASDEQLKTAQAKITYLGVQTKAVPTVVFAVEGHEIVMVRFLSVQRSVKPYDNDELPYTKRFGVSAHEFRQMMAAVKPVLDSITTQRPDFLSFTALSGAGNAIVGEEVLIPRPLGKPFYAALLGAVSPTNASAKEILSQQFRNVVPQ